jgi:predicted transcriptional regulator
VLATLDGDTRDIEDLAIICGFSKVRAQHAVEALIKRRFVRRATGEIQHFGKNHYELDAAGRAYCIEQGWSL